MTLKIDGPSTRDKLEQLEAAGANAVSIEAAKDGDDVRAAVEVSHESKRWSVAGFVDYVRRKGWGAGGKATIKLGE